MTRLAIAEWWIAPGNRLFVVPIEKDGSCEFWAIQKLVEQFCWDAGDTEH